MKENCERQCFPRWLTLRQSLKYCPFYGEKHLIGLIKTGKVKGGQLLDKGTRDWFIDRESLDRYMESQFKSADEDGSKQKIIENFRRLV